MRRSTPTRLGSILVLLALPLLLAGKCQDDTSNPLDPQDQEFDANVTLRATNTQDQCLHLFAPGEDFPCCQVCITGGVSGSRTTVVHLKNGSRYTFRAGRNGFSFQEVECVVAGGGSDHYEVEWNGVLQCKGGFQAP